MLTQSRLKELLHYEPLTGAFTALVSGPNRALGSRVGWVGGKGYRYAWLDGRAHRLNRLAWLYMTGDHPACMIDHKDRDRANDAWSNLRPATNAENGRNCGLSKRNSSGVKGVYWSAQIRVDRRLLSLGYFDRIEDAAAARRAAEQKHFGEFAPATAIFAAPI